jgi:hypothetical protein
MRHNARIAQLGVSLYRLQRGLMTGDTDAREAARDRMRTRERQARGMMSASPPRRLVRRFLRTAPDFRAHYNCACIYGVLLQSSDGSPEYVDRAIEQLREVVRAGRTERVYGWALDDPDLAALWALVEEHGRRRDDVDDTRLVALDLLRHQLAPGPTIRRIAPEEGPPGADVRIRGINFHTTPEAEIVVTFGDQRAPLLSVATAGFDTELRVRVPHSLTPGAVDVAVALGEHSSVTKPFHVVGPER